MSDWRRWAFPTIAMVILPLALAAALEVALRVGGAGHPASFFVRQGDRFVSNARFGWRFFPVPLARTPLVTSFAARKLPNTFRVFVLGESAAMGIPEPAFGFSRMLEVMLEEGHPGIDVEMINTAMTAINSHVVREIAAECAGHQPDLFVVYLGNNEVVGPWGPATVFTAGAPSLPLIRLRMALEHSRIGQLAERTLVAARPLPAAQWRGMEMLVDRQIPADDPRLERTYAQFRDNLQAILDSARDAGAPVIVSTVATNLRDPPFASLQGRDHQDAELQHQLGIAAWREGRAADAWARLSRARDLDLLRFRADSRINDIIREVATRAGGRVTLLDAERLLAKAAGGAPGDDLFWEHVHLNPAGSYLLASALFADATRHVRRESKADARPAAFDRVAELLALTAWDRRRMAAAIFDMMKRPPFTRQLGHAARLARRRAIIQGLTVDLAGAERMYRGAIARRPDDDLLRVNLAMLLREGGRHADAAAEWRRLLERSPGIVEWESQLAFALADAGRMSEAERRLRDIAAREPELPAAHVNLGNVLERQQRADEAAASYREALRLDTRHETARLNLAALESARGNVDEAERLYRDAIAADPRSAEAHGRLAALLDKRGRADEAMSEYGRALQLDRDVAWVHNNLAYLLERRGEIGRAIAEYRAAVESDPDYLRPRVNLVDLLLRAGRREEAAAELAHALPLARSQGDARLAESLEQQLRQIGR